MPIHSVPESSPRRRSATRIALGLLAAAGCALAVLTSAVVVGLRSVQCIADFSEDTVIAPRSFAGRYLCRIEGSEITAGPTEWYALGAGALLGVVALLALALRAPGWIRRGLVAATVLLPAAMAFAALVVPADCTDGQWDRHGANGCERSEELRPGIDFIEPE